MGPQTVAVSKRRLWCSFSRKLIVRRERPSSLQGNNEGYTSSIRNVLISSTSSPILSLQALAPDAYVTLADEIPADTGQKRATKAVQRTDAWGRECLQAAAQRGIRGLPLAAITGGTHLHLRTQSAQLAAKQPVAGELHARLQAMIT